MTALINLRLGKQLAADQRRIVEWEAEEILVELGIVFRIEFRGSRCNLTLKNTQDKKQSVNVRVYVLNNALIEIWQQSEKWTLASLQPNQVHVTSWEFTPSLPDVVWNEKAGSIFPRWVVVDVI